MPEESKAELERNKLSLEIKDLQRSPYSRPTFWISVVTAIVAVGGVLGQSVLSNIKVEYAKLEAEKRTRAADLRVEQAKKEEIAAKQRAIESTQKAKSELKETEQRILVAREELARIEKAGVPRALVESLDNSLLSISQDLEKSVVEFGVQQQRQNEALQISRDILRDLGR